MIILVPSILETDVCVHTDLEYCDSMNHVVCFLLGNSRRLNFKCRRFVTLRLFHLHRWVGVKNSSYLHAYEDGAECSENVGI